MEIFNYPAITSTNDYAKEHINEYDRVIVTSAHQWLGRGRNQHHWEGDYGKNVYLSYGIRHKIPININSASVYQSFGGLVVKHALDSFSPERIFKIKYPNDIVADIGGEMYKIAWVLVEHSFTGSLCFSTVIGIGINVLQETFSEEVTSPATSLKLLGINVRIQEVTDQIIREIEHYDSLSLDAIKKEWIHELNLTGKKIKIKNMDGEWLFEGFETDLRIRVKGVDSKETVIISNGDSVQYSI